jgi:hypothetical protein
MPDLTCTLPCVKCSNSDTTCTACSGTTYLSGTTCPSKFNCPSGFWGDLSDPTCKSCTSPSLACSGSDTTCTSCVKPMFLSLSTCVDSCPSGFGGIYLIIHAKAVHHLARHAQQATSCSSCVTSYFLSSTSCILTCPGGQYGDTSDNQCKVSTSPCTFYSGTATTLHQLLLSPFFKCSDLCGPMPSGHLWRHN